MKTVTPAARSELELFFAERLPEICSVRREPSGDSGFALPDMSLECLRQMVKELAIENVFEFGSGRSTKVFLDSGCNVTSLEDNAKWLERTANSLSPDERFRLKAHCQPLQTLFDASAPLRSWALSGELRASLREAQLVLIDSPTFPPFREHALILSLRHARLAVIAVDDASIPTVRRFCFRIAARNGLAHFYTEMDHGLFFFLPPEGDGKIDSSRSGLETLKAWRRFFLARK